MSHLEGKIRRDQGMKTMLRIKSIALGMPKIGHRFAL